MRPNSDDVKRGDSPLPAQKAVAAGAVAETSGNTGVGPTASEHHDAPLWNNVITMGGIFVVMVAVLGLVTFGLFHAVAPVTNPYVDIVGYLIIPGILAIGVAFIPLGVLFKSWRLHRHDPLQRVVFRFPHIDLTDPLQRRAAKIVAGGTFVILPVVGVTSYHGYHFTDSARFCAKTCHSVMEPQATAYEHSAHARVPCAECHIGAGASWFVKSKLSGTRQVLAVWRDSYPRPIPPAIANLRPARETCEHCHWPRKFFGAQLKELVHYASDEKNTRSAIDMLLNTGGGDESIGRAEGIHMHMALANRVEYIAVDDRLQDIPWVKATDAAGNELVYRSDGKPSSDPIPEGKVRRLDCMDCHNRPAHRFRSPSEAVDLFLEVGRIDTTLPFIKREAVASLVRGYPDTATAHAQIGLSLIEFYRTRYPDIWNTRRASINQAIDVVRHAYDQGFFPAMRVDWQTYPDNIGHKVSPGCFRCHDGKHVNQRGEALTTQCNLCHTFLNPTSTPGGTSLLEQGEFVHPMELPGVHKQVLCHKCHDGGTARPTTCEGCHDATTGLRSANFGESLGASIKPDPMADLECDACHDISQPRSVATIEAKCIDCHDQTYAGMIARWQADVEQARTAAQAANREDASAAMNALDRAGPMHNPAAAIAIYNAIAGKAAPTTPGGETSTRP